MTETLRKHKIIAANEHGGAKFERTDAQIMHKFKKKFGLTFSKFIPIFTEFSFLFIGSIYCIYSAMILVIEHCNYYTFFSTSRGYE